MAYSLSRDYSQVPKDIPSDILDIVQTRQNGLIRRARTTLGSWCGSIISFSLVSYSIRFYDWKSKLIILPFTTYGGCLLGRFISHGITGRWSESYRDSIMAEFPPKEYVNSISNE